MNKERDVFEADGMRIDITRTDLETKLLWRGRYAVQNPEEVLWPFFVELLATQKGKKLILDFTQTEYVNSAMLSPLLKFIKQLDKHKIKTLLIYDIKIEWQLVTCKCMKAVANLLKNIEIQP